MERTCTGKSHARQTSNCSANGRHDIRLSLFVFALNSTSAQWCVETLSIWHAATLPLQHCGHVIGENYSFFAAALYWTKRAAWWSSRCWFYVNRCIFREDPKTFFHISVAWPWPLTFDLETYKLFCQLLLTWVTCRETLNVARDRQTDRQTRCNAYAASWGKAA